MSNLTILEHNIIHGFGCYGGPESVERHFLSAIDSHGLLKAEAMANEFGALMDVIGPMVAFAIDGHGAEGSVVDSVCEFIQERHLNYRGGGNMKLMKVGA